MRIIDPCIIDTYTLYYTRIIDMRIIDTCIIDTRIIDTCIIDIRVIDMCISIVLDLDSYACVYDAYMHADFRYMRCRYIGS